MDTLEPPKRTFVQAIRTLALPLKNNSRAESDSGCLLSVCERERERRRSTGAPSSERWGSRDEGRGRVGKGGSWAAGSAAAFERSEEAGSAAFERSEETLEKTEGRKGGTKEKNVCVCEGGGR